MKVLSVISLTLGTIVSIVGLLPFIFAYPYCNECTNSGPSNLWELIIMNSYTEKGWYLFVGIALLFLSFLLTFRQRN